MRATNSTPGFCNSSFSFHKAFMICFFKLFWWYFCSSLALRFPFPVAKRCELSFQLPYKRILTAAPPADIALFALRDSEPVRQSVTKRCMSWPVLHTMLRECPEQAPSKLALSRRPVAAIRPVLGAARIELWNDCAPTFPQILILFFSESISEKKWRAHWLTRRIGKDKKYFSSAKARVQIKGLKLAEGKGPVIWTEDEDEVHWDKS